VGFIINCWPLSKNDCTKQEVISRIELWRWTDNHARRGSIKAISAWSLYFEKVLIVPRVFLMGRVSESGGVQECCTSWSLVESVVG
jgi:hypothetical protein